MWDVDIKLHVSDGLAFVLGFEKEVMIKQRDSMSKKAVKYCVVDGQYIVDRSAGLNFTFLDSDKIENMTVRFEHR